MCMSGARQPQRPLHAPTPGSSVNGTLGYGPFSLTAGSRTRRALMLSAGANPRCRQLRHTAPTLNPSRPEAVGSAGAATEPILALCHRRSGSRRGGRKGGYPLFPHGRESRPPHGRLSRNSEKLNVSLWEMSGLGGQKDEFGGSERQVGGSKETDWGSKKQVEGGQQNSHEGLI